MLVWYFYKNWFAAGKCLSLNYLWHVTAGNPPIVTIPRSMFFRISVNDCSFLEQNQASKVKTSFSIWYTLTVVVFFETDFV